jgi:hypothetical protein
LAAEFLESTGTQYIDTGYVLNNNSRVYCRYFVKKATISGERVWGSYVSGGSNSFAYWHSPYGSIYFAYGDAAPAVALGNNTGGVFEIYANAEQWALTGPRTVSKTFVPQVFETFSTAYLFTYNYKNQAFVSNFKGRIYDFKIENVLLYKPAISPNGAPCMFDTVGKQPFYNSGSGAFIVGMTLAQARQLGKLPAGGGTLKVSLPSNYLENEGVVNAIAEANAKGWNIEVASTWDASAASATFALRRIWVRKTQAEQGNYVAADGNRWAVESCVAMYNADGSEPDAHGYEPFRSVDAAVAYWELVPYVYPDEELLTVQ